MKTTLTLVATLFLGLGCIHSTEAQLLNKLKKKAEKKVEKAVDGKPATKKNVPKRPTATKPTTTAKTTSKTTPSGTAKTSNKTSTKPKSTQPSYVDTTRARNAFWKADIAQQLLLVTGHEPYQDPFGWKKAKTFTEAYTTVQKVIENKMRPNVSSDLVDYIRVSFDPKEFDNLFRGANERMGGPFSSTDFWKKTSQQASEWLKTAQKWKNSPPSHFDKEGIKFQTSATYLNSVEIDTVSNENEMVIRFDVKGFDEPKVFTYLTSHQNDSKSFSEEYSKITALDNGYFQFVYKKSHQVIFGLDKKEALQIETSSPLFPESDSENCIPCKNLKGGLGKIVLSTEIQPNMSNEIPNITPWDGISPLYASFYLPESLQNLISHENPWENHSIRLRWYVKDEMEKAEEDWRPHDINAGANSFFSNKLYNGIGNEDLKATVYDYLHYLIMKKGSGTYNIVAELYRRVGDDNSNFKKIPIAVGEKTIELSNQNYKRLFVGGEKEEGSYRPPKYIAPAPSGLTAAAARKYSAKKVYLTTDSAWKPVKHSVTGRLLYYLNDGVVAITNKNDDGAIGSYYVRLSAKREGGRYEIVGAGSFWNTSKQNFNISGN